MEKPFDREINKLSKSQLIVLKYLLQKSDSVVSAKDVARRTGIVEKNLGGVLSAMSRKRLGGMSLIEPMGRDTDNRLRWKLNTKAITVALALGRVKLLIAQY